MAGLPPDFVVAITALSGTAIGLASSRTIGNIFAGFWVLLTHPYHTGDFISLGSGIEGIVKENTLNYTRIRTINDNTIFVSNQKILDRDITNFRIEVKNEKITEGKIIYYQYPLEFSFDTVAFTNKKIIEIIESVVSAHVDEFYKRPTYRNSKLSRLDKSFILDICVKNARDLLRLIPQILGEIAEYVDKTPGKTSKAV